MKDCPQILGSGVDYSKQSIILRRAAALEIPLTVLGLVVVFAVSSDPNSVRWALEKCRFETSKCFIVVVPTE